MGLSSHGRRRRLPAGAAPEQRGARTGSRGYRRVRGVRVSARAAIRALARGADLGATELSGRPGRGGGGQRRVRARSCAAASGGFSAVAQRERRRRPCERTAAKRRSGLGRARRGRRQDRVPAGSSRDVVGSGAAAGGCGRDREALWIFAGVVHGLQRCGAGSRPAAAGCSCTAAAPHRAAVAGGLHPRGPWVRHGDSPAAERRRCDFKAPRDGPGSAKWQTAGAWRDGVDKVMLAWPHAGTYFFQRLVEQIFEKLPRASML